MEAGIFFSVTPFSWSSNFKCTLCPVHRSFPRILRASSSSSLNSQGSYRGPKPSRDLVADWVSKNDDAVRSLPIYVGGISLLVVLFNRAVSGIAPVADASRKEIPSSITWSTTAFSYSAGVILSQSRADLLTLGLAVTNVLAGLVWLSIRPKSITPVKPKGVACERICPSLPDPVTSELLWSLVVVYEGICIFQVGFAAESAEGDGEAEHVESSKLMQGSLYKGILKSQAQSYLANLSLYPGKSELPFLPSNTQAVILQPLGEKGIAIIGGNTIRGFTTSDQAWISLVGEKLDATLMKYSNNFQPPVNLSSKGTES